MLSGNRSDSGRNTNHRQAAQDLVEHPIARNARFVHEDATLSVTADLSNHSQEHDHHPRRADEHISEQPDESEHASSPAGSIGDHHDIMSENIESNIVRFKSGKSILQQDEMMSNYARKSEVTNKVPEVSPPVPVGDTSRSVSQFSAAFDSLYATLQTQLFEEYQRMRVGYVQTYEENLDSNRSQKQERISEI
jgi:hypothetical protein